MEIKYYEILWGNNTSDLSEKVNKEMKFGWQPLGGVASGNAITMGQERNILIQAMIKEE